MLYNRQCEAGTCPGRDRHRPANQHHLRHRDGGRPRARSAERSNFLVSPLSRWGRCSGNDLISWHAHGDPAFLHHTFSSPCHAGNVIAVGAAFVYCFLLSMVCSLGKTEANTASKMSMMFVLPSVFFAGHLPARNHAGDLLRAWRDSPRPPLHLPHPCHHPAAQSTASNTGIPSSLVEWRRSLLRLRAPVRKIG